MRGWDPILERAKSMAGNTGRQTCVETGAEGLHLDSMKLHLIRARAMQRCDMHEQALEEYKAVELLGKNLSFLRTSAIETIKILLAKGDFFAARAKLVVFIEDEVFDADRRFPEPFELIKVDRRLALLLMLANAGTQQLGEYFGYNSFEQRLRFSVASDGSLQRAVPIRESELHRISNYAADRKILNERAEKAKQAEAKRTHEEDQDFLRLKTRNMISKYKLVLTDLDQEMQELLQRKRELAVSR